MAYLLHIETSTRNCSVALSDDDRLIAVREVAESGYSHAERLHVFIDELFTQTSIDYTDLSAVAVSSGPGSYTGLRIGVSAAKGLCYATGVPLISVDTLAVLASQAKVSDGQIVPMIDARRMEVYSAVFTPQLDKTGATKAEILTDQSYQSAEKIYIVGDCQPKCRSVLKGPNIHFLEDVCFPSARQMPSLAFGKFQSSDFEDVAYFEPFYLKDFISTSAK